MVRPLSHFISVILFVAGVSLQAQSTGEAPVPESYTIIEGHLRIKPYDKIFHNMDINEKRNDTIFIYNSWSSSMQIIPTDLPVFLKIAPERSIIPPLSFSYLIAEYDAGLRNDMDICSDIFSILTNDTLSPLKTLQIVAVITEQFGQRTPREKRNSPVATIDVDQYDFGTIKQGEIARYDLTLTNTGKDTLFIRKIKSSCGCTTTKPKKLWLLPNEYTTIIITFNTYGREGLHSKHVTIITNDPENPYFIFNIKGEIIK